MVRFAARAALLLVGFGLMIGCGEDEPEPAPVVVTEPEPEPSRTDRIKDAATDRAVDELLHRHAPQD